MSSKNESWGLTEEEMDTVIMGADLRKDRLGHFALCDSQLRKFRERLEGYQYVISDEFVLSMDSGHVYFRIPEADWQKLCKEAGEET